MDEQQNEKIGLERHVQTVLLAIITAAIIGGWVKIGNMSDTLIQMVERSSANQDRIELMKRSMDRMSEDINGLKERMIRAELKDNEKRK